MAEPEMRNIGQIIRTWGGSRYVPLTKFLKKIGIDEKDIAVHVSVSEVSGMKAIIITKDRLPDKEEDVSEN